MHNFNVFISPFVYFFSLSIVNAFMSAAQAQGDKGKDPLIKLVIHPQEHVIIPEHSYAFLHCAANYTVQPVDDYENDEPMVFPDDEDFQLNDAPSDALSRQNSGSNEAKVENQCSQDVQYQWQRDGKPIYADSESSVIQTFCNGTIKIKHSSMATGIYRCVASTTSSVDGAVISKASHVQAAGKFQSNRPTTINC